MLPGDWQTDAMRYQRVTPESLDAALYARCCQFDVVDLAIGMREVPSLDYLRHHLFERQTLALYQLWPTAMAAPCGLGVLSLYTSQVTTGACLDGGWRDDWTVAVLADLAAAAFAMEPAHALLWTHLALPEPATAPHLMVGLGYELGARNLGLEAAPCASYLLQREIFALYRGAAARPDDDDDD